MAFEDTIDIAAPIEMVWALLADVDELASFVPTFSKIERDEDGPIAIGTTVRLTQPLQGTRTWTITELSAPSTFVWESKAPGVRMIAGHHLESRGHGCRQILRVDMTGPGAFLVRVLSGRMIRRALRAENEAFKERAEAA